MHSVVSAGVSSYDGSTLPKTERDTMAAKTFTADGRTPLLIDDLVKMPLSERLDTVGHRGYVGGPTPETWFGIGRLQYQFLVSQGLKPHHDFMDVACGSLRLGQFLIPYLDAGRYFGLEGQEDLVKAGLETELAFGLAQTKKPSFGFNYDFDFSFATRFDYAIAQSLFTHLTAEDIAKCFENLRPLAAPTSQFFFTFKSGSDPHPDSPSDPHKGWQYQFDTLRQIARDADWTADLIGDWQHPRNQQMAVARPR